MWHKAIWNKYNIPKHSFIAWLAIRDSLPTQDRIIQWKENPPDLVCVFCKDILDSCSHLFFGC
ncbi:hypothetical protein RYX45_25605, partial [Alkalihalophilus pseudofirmus]